MICKNKEQLFGKTNRETSIWEDKEIKKEDTKTKLRGRKKL